MRRSIIGTMFKSESSGRRPPRASLRIAPAIPASTARRRRSSRACRAAARGAKIAAPMIDYDARRWFHLALHVRGSVVPRVLGRVVASGLVGAGAVVAHQRFGTHVAPLLHSLIGAALGLLLVFRTNAAYDRWW